MLPVSNITSCASLAVINQFKKALPCCALLSRHHAVCENLGLGVSALCEKSSYTVPSGTGRMVLLSRQLDVSTA